MSKMSKRVAYIADELVLPLVEQYHLGLCSERDTALVKDQLESDHRFQKALEQVKKTPMWTERLKALGFSVEEFDFFDGSRAILKEKETTHTEVFTVWEGIASGCLVELNARFSEGQVYLGVAVATEDQSLDGAEIDFLLPVTHPLTGALITVKRGAARLGWFSSDNSSGAHRVYSAQMDLGAVALNGGAVKLEPLHLRVPSPLLFKEVVDQIGSTEPNPIKSLPPRWFAEEGRKIGFTDRIQRQLEGPIRVAIEQGQLIQHNSVATLRHKSLSREELEPVLVTFRTAGKEHDARRSWVAVTDRVMVVATASAEMLSIAVGRLDTTSCSDSLQNNADPLIAIDVKIRFRNEHQEAPHPAHVYKVNLPVGQPLIETVEWLSQPLPVISEEAGVVMEISC